jgi:hypothetical protein
MSGTLLNSFLRCRSRLDVAFIALPDCYREHEGRESCHAKAQGTPKQIPSGPYVLEPETSGKAKQHWNQRIENAVFDYYLGLSLKLCLALRDYRLYLPRKVCPTHGDTFLSTGHRDLTSMLL